jgi:glyoxylase-like metal-dependent hydrolase (beta-lactamase superfamily II)
MVTTVAALALAGVLSAQQAKPAKPMQIEKVKDGLYVIRGPFNPCAPNGCGGAYGDDGLLHEAGDVAVRVTPEGLILVDDKFQNNVTEILEHVKSVSALPIRYLLNTHHHSDHAGGDAVFINTTEIIAHRNVRENFLRNKQPGAPRVTFNDQASVFLGNVEVRAYYFGRGHTNGDAWVVFPALRAMHAGDIFSGKNIPGLDAVNGGSGLAIADTLTKAADTVKNIDTIITGHSSTMTVADLREYARFNRDFANDVRAAKAAGKSADDVAKSWKIPATYVGYATPTPVRLLQNVQVVFDELK